MKKLLLLIVLIYATSCQKEQELPREKFLGQWTAINKVNGTSSPSSISRGENENQILWQIKGENIVLEFIGKNDSIAFQTDFSVPFFADNSASLKWINIDTLDGFRSFGTIFLPSTYKSEQYHLIR